MPIPEYYNVAAALAEIAARQPYQPGIIFPAGRDATGRAKTVQLSFQQLNAECDRYAHGLTEFGIRMGDRVLLMIHPGVELISVVFALVRMGAVPVIIDPGMGRQALLQCIAETEPAALIAVPIVHALRRLFPKPFATVQRSVVVGAQHALADATLESLRSSRSDPFPSAPTTAESEAVVAFTSGSTGMPKGVVYLHGMFRAQIDLLQNNIGVQEGEVDLALLYIFALFNPALGVTTIIPDMDPTQSAAVNPAYVVEAIQTYGVTNAFGSPTIWKRVVPYCVEHDIRLPSLKRILMAGAPVPPALIETLLTRILGPDAEVNTPFGATEALPLTSISGREIVAETAALSEQGRGMCIGRPLPGIDVRVIRITDDAIPVWDDGLLSPQGEVGEIVVKGPVVTRVYLHRPEQTALAKIRDADGGVWHRMGDVGYFDAQGRLWFCGRKAHRVTTRDEVLFPVPCETIFNHHPAVNRTALVGIGPQGRQRPVLVVEPRAGHMPTSLLEKQKFTLELLALGAEYEHTRAIQDVLFYRGVFPTDVRHNAKIQREKLAVWAARHDREALRGVDMSRSPSGQGEGLPPGVRIGDLFRALGVLLSVAVSVIFLRRYLSEKGSQGVGSKQ
ncbi:MAG TPA: fatty acid CoA ligase family protein [Anaerolineae bacterium]|nr:fatty acid CoA ligase family protein [Anaerolineae bacterium]HQH36993.1 fatty acid CoA ligase family protein [Anaerolineae bacterium]